MLFLHNTKIAVKGTEYTVEYSIVKNPSEYELHPMFEYGIKCTLLGADDELISADEIKCITPDFKRICEIIRILERNQVFPVHLREIVSELLELQLEETKIPACN